MVREKVIGQWHAFCSGNLFILYRTAFIVVHGGVKGETLQISILIAISLAVEIKRKCRKKGNFPSHIAILLSTEMTPDILARKQAWNLRLCARRYFTSCHAIALAWKQLMTL